MKYQNGWTVQEPNGQINVSKTYVSGMRLVLPENLSLRSGLSTLKLDTLWVFGHGFLNYPLEKHLVFLV
jgi:hypothetical protein